MGQKVFITGGTSYLGLHMVPFMVERGCEVLHSWNSTPPPADFPGSAVQLNVRDGDQVSHIVSDFRPDTIIHLAGSNRSSSEEMMVSSIIEGAKNVAAVAQQLNCRLIHMSTDVIFDGTGSPYSEESTPTPKHAYGRAKAEAEKIVGRWDNTAIIRPSLIYSLKFKDRSIEWMERTIRRGEQVTLFTNQVRNPVWTGTLCSACVELSTHEFTGPINVVGTQTMNRAEFGDKMLDWWGIKPNGLIQHLPQPADAPWPLDLRLDTALASTLLETPLFGVDEVFNSLS